MRRYKYQAVITLAAGHDGGQSSALPSPVCRAVVRAFSHEAHCNKLFSALISCDDGEPPQDSSLHVTMVVLGDDVADCLGPGESFVLWRGGDVGHGTVTRRVFV
jgi:hypothetical protein